jgi:hypothetical protein
MIYILLTLYKTNYFRIISERRIFDLTERFSNHELITMRQEPKSPFLYMHGKEINYNLYYFFFHF